MHAQLFIIFAHALLLCYCYSFTLQRAAAKAAKDWAAADSVRTAITALGYSVKDVAGGVQVTKLPQE
jgi:cysteinyl-tRNA synthetase